MRKRFRYSAGEQFGSWVVLGPPVMEHNQHKYPCRCLCGTEKHVAGTHLRNGKSTKCQRCQGLNNMALSFERNKNEKGQWIYSDHNGHARRPWVRFAAMEFLKKQNSMCPICEQPLAQDLSDGVIDHDHKTMVMRGIVHRGCNVLIGWFDRNPNIGNKMTEYLERTR